MMPFICSYRNKIEDNNAVPEWVGRLGGEGFWVVGDDDDDVFYFLLRGGVREGRPFGGRRISPIRGFGPVTFKIRSQHTLEPHCLCWGATAS